MNLELNFNSTIELRFNWLEFKFNFFKKIQIVEKIVKFVCEYGIGIYIYLYI